MSQDNDNRRRIIGTVAAVIVFLAWILLDLYVFPLIGLPINYPLYELVTYGSWAVIALVCFFLLYWAGWFPMKKHEIPSDSTISEI